MDGHGLALSGIGRHLQNAPAMRADFAANRAIAAQGFVHNALDGASAAAALRAAAETAVNLPHGARRVLARLAGGANIAVTQDVAGTNNHDPADDWLLKATIDSGVLAWPQKQKALFKRNLNCAAASG
jgi:hypothetical protein